MSVRTSRNESDSTFDWRSRAKRAAFCRPSEKHSTLRPSLGNSSLSGSVGWIPNIERTLCANGSSPLVTRSSTFVSPFGRRRSLIPHAGRTLSPTPCTVLVRRLFSRDLNLNMSGRPFVVYADHQQDGRKQSRGFVRSSSRRASVRVRGLDSGHPEVPQLRDEARPSPRCFQDLTTGTSARGRRQSVDRHADMLLHRCGG